MINLPFLLDLEAYPALDRVAISKSLSRKYCGHYSHHLDYNANMRYIKVTAVTVKGLESIGVIKDSIPQYKVKEVL